MLPPLLLYVYITTCIFGKNAFLEVELPAKYGKGVVYDLFI